MSDPDLSPGWQFTFAAFDLVLVLLLAVIGTWVRSLNQKIENMTEDINYMRGRMDRND